MSTGVIGLAVTQATNRITEYGESCQWMQSAAPVAEDPSKPWIVTQAEPTSNAVKILFKRSGNGLDTLLKGSSVKGGSTKALMAAQGFVPAAQDRITRADGSTLEVEDVSPLTVGGTTIMYFITFVK